MSRYIETTKKNASGIMVDLPSIGAPLDGCTYMLRFTNTFTNGRTFTDLLVANPHIKDLKCGYVFNVARECLLKAFANGTAGCSLESLDLIGAFPLVDSRETDLLERYVRKKQNLKRLAIALEGGPATLRLLSTLASTAVESLRLELSSSDRFGSIGKMLGQCSNICSLRIILVNISDRHGRAKSLFSDGIATMQSLVHLHISTRQMIVTPSIVSSMGSLVSRKRALAHFGITIPKCTEGCGDQWLRLAWGLALSRVSHCRSTQTELCFYYCQS